MEIITEEQIRRINELYHSSKTPEGLSEKEKEEQRTLREAYIRAVRENLRGTLNSIDLVDSDGTITSLKEKYGTNDE